MLVWSLTSLKAQMNERAYKRKEETFWRPLPKKGKDGFPEMYEKNQEKAA